MRRSDDRSRAAADSESSLSIGDLLRMLRRRALLIISLTTIATIVGFVILVLIPNRYDAFAVVQLDPRLKTLTKIENVFENLRGDTPTIESETEIAVSGPVLRAVMERLDLFSDPELTQPDGLVVELYRRLGWAVPTIVYPPRQTEPTRPRPEDFEVLSGARGDLDTIKREPALISFASRIGARRVRNTLLIEIRYSSRDPVKAARVATAIAESYVLNQIETKREGARVANSVLEGRIAELRGKLADAERNMEALKSELGVYQTEGGPMTERQLSREIENLVEARKRSANTKARYDEARAALDGAHTDSRGTDGFMAVTSVPEVFRSNTLRTLSDELDKLLRRAAETNQKYGPLHPERQRSEAEVLKARNTLTAEIANVVTTARAEHAIAVESERQIESQLDALKAQINRMKERDWQLQALDREAKTSREIYEHLLSRKKQMVEAADLQIADSRVIDRAVVPLRPAAPKRKQLLVAITMGGLALALMLAFMLEIAQPGMATPAHAERELDLPVLAVVPAVRPPAGPTPALVTQAPSGAFAESIREVRLALDDGRPPGRSRIIMVASSLPGEGRSLIAANLATLYAMTSGRTLLIDADMRRGRLSIENADPTRPGLLEIVTEGASVDAAISHDPATGLAFLASSRRPDYAIPASEILAAPVTAALLTRLACTYETIIIDAPPLLAVVDARILANSAEDIIFVTLERRTPRDTARRALRALGQNEDKVLGIVVNRSHVRAGARTPYVNDRPASLQAPARERQPASHAA